MSEAERLADELERAVPGAETCVKAAAELRRLRAALDKEKDYTRDMVADRDKWMLVAAERGYKLDRLQQRRHKAKKGTPT